MKECSSCRKSLPDNASYCYDCTAKSIGHDNISKYQAMGGWLLFFMILSAISVIANLANAYNAIRAISTLRELAENVAIVILPDAAFYLLNINVIMIFVIIVLESIFIIQVFSRKSRFLFFYQLACFFGILIGILSLIALNIMIDGAYGGGRVVFNLFLAVCSLLLFTWYYSSSIRVRVYMDNDEYFTKAIFTLEDKDEAFITEKAERTASI